MMRELKYIHYRDNDFTGSISTYNRHYYSHSTNVSNYLSYNNIHHYQQQVQFKRLSSRIRHPTQRNQCQRQVSRSYRYSQENNIQNSSNKVKNEYFIQLKN
jgi:hypothetical protein